MLVTNSILERALVVESCRGLWSPRDSEKSPAQIDHFLSFVGINVAYIFDQADSRMSGLKRSFGCIVIEENPSFTTFS